MFMPDGPLPQEMIELIEEHNKRFGNILNLLYCPDDMDYIDMRLRKALKEGVPYDPVKEFDESCPEWFRKGLENGTIWI